MELKISIVTCSDTRDLAQDEAGAALEELIKRRLDGHLACGRARRRQRDW